MLERCRPFADVLLGLLLVLLVDLAAFHQGLYFRWLRPDSYSGRVEESSRRFAAMRRQNPLRRVVMMSNSTGGSCLAEKVLEDELQAAGWPLAAINLSSGGSSARAWYFLLGHEQVQRETTALVVLGVHYRGLVHTDGQIDLQTIKTRLDPLDLLVLPTSFPEAELRFKASTAVFFRSPLFGEDLRDFLADPAERRAKLTKARKAEERFEKGWRRAILSRENVTQARLGADGQIDRASLSAPVRDNAELVAELESQLQRQARGQNAATPMEIAPEQAYMLRRSVRLLAGRGIPVVVALMPHSPFPPPGPTCAPLETLVKDLAAEGLPVRFFRDAAMLSQVESPTYFRDPLHVNATGAELYTRALAGYLAAAFESSELKIDERRGVVRGEQNRRPDQAGDAEGPQE